MSKKNANRRHGAPHGAAFDDSAYENVRFSATYEYNELGFSRAAALLCPRGQNAVLAAAFVSLAGMIAMLLIFKGTVVPSLPFLLVALVSTTANSNWPKLQYRYARSSTLALGAASERRHVVVCDDAVHVQVEGAEAQSYPLSELRRVYDTDECLVAGFGGRRYVYVPRAALSESRFRELERFLRGAEK